MSAKGLLSIVLHAHVPFVRHCEKEWAPEEDWFFAAVTETCVPLIALTERLAHENMRAAFTVSLSPTLCAMLEDELLAKRCRGYVENRLAFVDEELARLAEDSPEHKTALGYAALYETALEIMDRYSGDLITPFKQLQQNGLLEIITSPATHALLPLLIHPEAVRAQVAAAAEDYADRFSRRTRGMWLSECAFEPRLTQQLQLAGIKYFFLENHAFSLANPRPRCGVYAPARLKGGVYAWAREAGAAARLGPGGYAADPVYRDFGRDAGFDADYETVRPYLHPDGARRGLGVKYHRNTGAVPAAGKQLYDPAAAAARAREHAADFLKSQLALTERIYAEQGIRPVITCACDAQLFGRRWFEGPQFLENLVRAIRQERLPIQTATASECLEAGQANCGDDIEPEASSWGEGGYFEPWVTTASDWIYPRVNAAAEKMIELANRFQFQDMSSVEKRVLAQAAREVLLAQSSDWADMMRQGEHAEYARGRVLGHCENFFRLARMAADKRIDETVLRELEARNNVFLNLNFRAFASASTF